MNNNFQIKFNSKTAAILFMDSLPSNKRTKSSIIQDNFKIKLRCLKFVRPVHLDISSTLTENEFRTKFYNNEVTLC